MPIEAAAPTSIPARILKRCSNSLAWPLCTLFNNSFKLGNVEGWEWSCLFVFWKQLCYSTLHERSKMKLESYRPVSLASVVSKFVRRFKGSASLNPSIWFYGGAFLPTEITRHKEPWTRFSLTREGVTYIYSGPDKNRGRTFVPKWNGYVCSSLCFLH